MAHTDTILAGISDADSRQQFKERMQHPIPTLTSWLLPAGSVDSIQQDGKLAYSDIAGNYTPVPCTVFMLSNVRNLDPVGRLVDRDTTYHESKSRIATEAHKIAAKLEKLGVKSTVFEHQKNLDDGQEIYQIGIALPRYKPERDKDTVKLSQRPDRESTALFLGYLLGKEYLKKEDIETGAGAGYLANIYSPTLRARLEAVGVTFPQPGNGR